MITWTLQEWLKKFYRSVDTENSASLTTFSAQNASTMNLSGKEQLSEETSADFQTEEGEA